MFYLFVNIQKIYNKNLRLSIKTDLENGLLKRCGNSLNYNYLILDGTLLLQLLDSIEKDDLLTPSIKNAIFERFKELIFYAGKGVNNRKFSHLLAGKKICLKQLALEKITAKFSKIAHIWEKGHGIVVLQLFSETNRYEALSREFAVIKALGLNNLTNANNSCAYGDMKNNWNYNETVNFGNMILFNALTMTVNERPTVLYKEDITISEIPKRDTTLEKAELLGILECFLEM